MQNKLGIPMVYNYITAQEATETFISAYKRDFKPMPWNESYLDNLINQFVILGESFRDAPKLAGELRNVKFWTFEVIANVKHSLKSHVDQSVNQSKRFATLLLKTNNVFATMHHDLLTSIVDFNVDEYRQKAKTVDHKSEQNQLNLQQSQHLTKLENHQQKLGTIYHYVMYYRTGCINLFKDAIIAVSQDIHLFNLFIAQNDLHGDLKCFTAIENILPPVQQIMDWIEDVSMKKFSYEDLLLIKTNFRAILDTECFYAKFFELEFKSMIAVIADIESVIQIYESKLQMILSHPHESLKCYFESASTWCNEYTSICKQKKIHDNIYRMLLGTLFTHANTKLSVLCKQIKKSKDEKEVALLRKSAKDTLDAKSSLAENAFFQQLTNIADNNRDLLKNLSEEDLLLVRSASQRVVSNEKWQTKSYFSDLTDPNISKKSQDKLIELAKSKLQHATEKTPGIRTLLIEQCELDLLILTGTKDGFKGISTIQRS